jgi:hypothetical protein
MSSLQSNEDGFHSLLPRSPGQPWPWQIKPEAHKFGNTYRNQTLNHKVLGYVGNLSSHRPRQESVGTEGLTKQLNTTRSMRKQPKQCSDKRALSRTIRTDQSRVAFSCEGEGNTFYGKTPATLDTEILNLQDCFFHTHP